jgi:hypothetical protein
MTTPRPPAANDDNRALNRRFATIQQWGTHIAVALMLATFTLYAAGGLHPYVPLQRLPALLGEGAAVYAREQAIPGGWSWLRELGHGDMLSLAGLVTLLGVPMAAYLGQLPLLVRRRDWVYVVLVLLQFAVFALAAGLLPLPGR